MSQRAAGYNYASKAMKYVLVIPAKAKKYRILLNTFKMGSGIRSTVMPLNFV